MLSSIASDLLRIPEAQLVLFRGTGVPFFPEAAANANPVCGSTIVALPTRSDADFRHQLALEAWQSDFVLLIAPESDGLLAGIVRLLEDSISPDTLLLNADSRRCALFADKLATHDWLIRSEIPAIPTCAVSNEALTDVLRLTTQQQDRDDPMRPAGRDDRRQPSDDLLSVIVKPRNGVGCDRVQRRTMHQALWATLSAAQPAQSEMIMQPFISGVACSVGLIGGGRRGLTTVLKPALQRISDDGVNLAYTGGAIPLPDPLPENVMPLVTRLVHALGPFNGYLGIDLVADAGSSGRVQVVEINPRLCTSYVGYRQLAAENLAGRLLQRTVNESVRWKSGRVEFDTLGHVSCFE